MEAECLEGVRPRVRPVTAVERRFGPGTQEKSNGARRRTRIEPPESVVDEGLGVNEALTHNEVPCHWPRE